MGRLILDSDFIIAYLSELDFNHHKAISFLEKNGFDSFIVVNLVKYEIANVLSRLFNQVKAIDLFESIDWKGMEEIYIDLELYQQAYLIYSSQTKKNISITDCTNLAIAEKLQLQIASFDKFYPATRRIVLE